MLGEAVNIGRNCTANGRYKEYLASNRNHPIPQSVSGVEQTSEPDFESCSTVFRCVVIIRLPDFMKEERKGKSKGRKDGRERESKGERKGGREVGRTKSIVNVLSFV